MSEAYKLAKEYYPAYWSIERVKALVKAGKLTAEEYYEITGERYK